MISDTKDLLLNLLNLTNLWREELLSFRLPNGDQHKTQPALLSGSSGMTIAQDKECFQGEHWPSTVWSSHPPNTNTLVLAQEMSSSGFEDLCNALIAINRASSDSGRVTGLPAKTRLVTLVHLINRCSMMTLVYNFAKYPNHVSTIEVYANRREVWQGPPCLTAIVILK